MRGKLQYMAPEQVRNEPIDRRVDLYALGVTLYHLATLESPFDRESDAAIVWAIAQEPVPSLATRRPDLPPAFLEMVDRCLAKDRLQRPATARDLLRQLPQPPSTSAAQLGARVLSLFPSSARPSMVEGDDSAPSGTQELLEAAARPPAPTAKARRPLRGALLGLGAAAAIGLALRMRAPPLPAPPPADAPVEEAAPTPPALAPAAREATPTPSPPSMEPSRDSTRSVRVAPEPSFLAVDAVPWAKVFVDGRRIGDTPIARFPVSRRKVTLMLVSPDTGKTVTRKLTLVPGQRMNIRIDLR